MSIEHLANTLLKLDPDLSPAQADKLAHALVTNPFAKGQLRELLEVTDGLFQTRSEEHGIAHWVTLEQALRKAETDLTIWKISFAAPDGSRVRLLRYGNSPDTWMLRLMEDELKDANV